MPRIRGGPRRRLSNRRYPDVTIGALAAGQSREQLRSLRRARRAARSLLVSPRSRAGSESSKMNKRAYVNVAFLVASLAIVSLGDPAVGQTPSYFTAGAFSYSP